MFSSLIFIFTSILLVQASMAAPASAPMLDDIDRLIASHHERQAHYQQQLDAFAQTITGEPSTGDLDNERFELYGQLFDMYRGFHLDSQQVCVHKRLALAARTGNTMHLQAAKLNQAEVWMRSGMYYDAICCMDSVAARPIDSALQPYYFHLRRTLYGLMEDFAITSPERAHYHTLTQQFRDSIIAAEAPGSFVCELVRADALCATCEYEQAIDVLEAYEAHFTHHGTMDSTSATISADQTNILSITKAQIYRAMGDQEQEKKHLIISAYADLQESKREYIALRDLAVLLYREGDIEHAYNYMTCAIEDANAGNMRTRTLEIGMIYPIIESAYQRQATIRTRLLYLLSASIALIALLAALFSIYYGRQRKRLAQMNAQLQAANANLTQSNHIKTVYVGRYMEMTSLLIERFDTWRKLLNQKSKSGDISAVQKELASQHFTQSQLAAFYHDFDEAFLHLFPHFVQDLQELLVDGVSFRIKQGELLNTDLRVMCCIRLGITDSAQIASFLRYSLSTIYNARTRMRNLAKGDRDAFETKVATL